MIGWDYKDDWVGSIYNRQLKHRFVKKVIYYKFCQSKT